LKSGATLNEKKTFNSVFAKQHKSLELDNDIQDNQTLGCAE
jgi:hypothetical protein